MRTIYIILVLLLASCERVTNEEQQLVGRWTWHLEDDGFGETGYLELRKDRTYSYLIESWNSTEKSSFSAPDVHYGWRVTDNHVCIARNFNNNRVEKEDCIWRIETDNTGSINLVIQGAVIRREIKAVREDG